MKTKLLTILTLATIFLGACSTSATPKQGLSTPIPGSQNPNSTTAVQGKEVEITISGNKFDPDNITIPIGTTVTWTNQDSVKHTVVADDKSWKSNSLAKGETFSYTFDKAGTYAYFCNIHPKMKGTIIVE